MTKQTEAMKLALEANTALREWVNAVPMDTPLPAMPGIDGDWLDSVDATIREALAEQQATEDDTDATIIQYHEATIKRLEARIAELERPVPAPEVRKQQEPVDKRCSPCPEFWDWLPRAYNFEGLGNFTKYNMEVAFLAGMQSTHLPAQPQQEPIVFYRCNGCGHAYEQVHPTSCDCMEAGGFDRVEYYTSPPAQPSQSRSDVKQLPDFSPIFSGIKERP